MSPENSITPWRARGGESSFRCDPGTTSEVLGLRKSERRREGKEEDDDDELAWWNMRCGKWDEREGREAWGEGKGWKEERKQDMLEE